MKKQVLFGLLAAGLFTACSNDDSQVEINKENGYELVEGQPAYISMGISLPGEPATRANDEFDDGDVSEYEVKSGKLVLFKGTSESNAVLFNAYDIPMSIFSNTANDGSVQITQSSSTYVQEISSPSLTSGQKLFAYVILNATGNATGIDYTAGTTWTAFSQKAFKAIGIADETKGQGAINSYGLVMTSVPLSTVAGGTADASTGSIETLAPIDPKCIYTSEAAAKNSTNSTCIYVERAAVKVEVSLTSGTKDLEGGTATLEGWALGNVNSSATGYYNTRQVDKSWGALFNEENPTSTTKYRFVCANALIPQVPNTTSHAERYRTYFAQDINYDGYTGLINGKVTTYGNADGGVTYTYENTFDEDNQLFGNTTFVGLQMKLNGGADFYTIGGDMKTMYASEADLKTKLVANLASQTATNAQITSLNTAIGTKITTALADATSELRTTAGCAATDVITYTLTPVVDLGTMTPATKTYDAYTAKLTLSDVKVNGSAAAAAVVTALETLAATELATALTFTREKEVTLYEDGVTYYAVRIAHFGDYETPWSAPSSAYNNYDKIYPTGGTSLHVSPETPVNYGASRKAAWLGRWGVVRNNWYKLSIGKINAVGSAVPVDYSGTATNTPGGTPDDNPEIFYISAHIHIVPWVKRTQPVDLK